MTEIGPEAETLIMEAATRTAITALGSASLMALRYWPSQTNTDFESSLALDITSKEEGIGNFATAADSGSERIIITAIQGEPLLADHRIMGEESEPVETASAWQWVIDGIDGTIPFKHGAPEFGILCGLLKAGIPELGLIALPALGQILVGRNGHGVRLLSLDGEELLHVQRNTLDQERPWDDLFVGYDVGYKGRADKLDRHVKKLIDQVGYCTSYCSTAYSNFRLALGALDAYFTQTPSLYDVVAPAAIIAELGGRVTDMFGQQIDWSAEQRSYLAAINPRVHAAVLGLLNTASVEA